MEIKGNGKELEGNKKKSKEMKENRGNEIKANAIFAKELYLEQNKYDLIQQVYTLKTVYLSS